MPAQVQSLPAAFGQPFVREAEVTQALHADVFRVRLPGNEPTDMMARLAVPGTTTLKPGDRVLVAGECPASGFIIGVLQSAGTQMIYTVEGAGARLCGEGPEQSITVNDTAGRVIFEYYPHTGRTMLCAAQGDLQLAAPAGRIELAAAEGIACLTPGQMDIRGQAGVEIAVPAPDGLPEQRLRIDSQGARIGVHQLSVSAGRGEVRMLEAEFHGKRLRSTVESARLIYGKLEMTVQRLWERSGQTIRQVRELCQLQAGRLRTLVSGSYSLQSERTAITARDEVRLDGKKINLG